MENFLCALAPLRDARRAMSWQVYVLRCGDGTLYTGIARDAVARLRQHEAGKGARYTRGRGPLSMVLLEAAATQGDALRREAAIKRLGRAAKEALISLAAAAATAKTRRAVAARRRRAAAGS